jgi:hypothetical protein
VTQNTRAVEPENDSTDVRKPVWRPLALALVAAGSARFTDWDADRVVAAPATDI